MRRPDKGDERLPERATKSARTEPAPPEREWFWPAFVIGMLLLSLGVGTSLLVAAHLVDDGPQIEEDYYTRAVDWDDHRALIERGMQLGWEVVVLASADAIEITVHDAEGEPVEGLGGELAVRRSSQAAPRLKAALEAGDAGFYHVDGAVSEPGLWDFFIDLHDAEGDVARFSVRHELR